MTPKCATLKTKERRVIEKIVDYWAKIFVMLVGNVVTVSLVL